MQVSGQNGKYLGVQLLVDFYGCDATVIATIESVRPLLYKCCELGEISPVKDTFHQFEPEGMSGVIVLEESHLTIHSWPEHQMVSMDFYTCGKAINPKAIEYLKEAFGASSYTEKVFDRAKLMR